MGPLAALLFCLTFCLGHNWTLAKPSGYGENDITMYDELPAKNLIQLCETLRQAKLPQVELVFDAYEQYVKLHKIEAGIGDTDEKILGSDQENKAKIRQLLEEPYVKIISENLFSVLPDEDTDGKLAKTQKLMKKVAKAIEGLGL